jgi:hypothetical protein
MKISSSSKPSLIIISRPIYPKTKILIKTKTITYLDSFKKKTETDKIDTIGRKDKTKILLIKCPSKNNLTIQTLKESPISRMTP